jgi:hypothetical protein
VENGLDVPTAPRGALCCEMPNGRSGGFLILKTELEQLLAAIPGAAIVGQMIRRPSEVSTLSATRSDVDAVTVTSVAGGLRNFAEQKPAASVESPAPIRRGRGRLVVSAGSGNRAALFRRFSIVASPGAAGPGP